MIPSTEEKFKSRYQIDLVTGCWNWCAYVMNTGYGEFYNAGKRWLAHRFSYQQYVGKIDAYLTIDHLCRNRRCVNPAHLEAVTAEENKRRGMSVPAINARKTHCKNGHELKEDNVYHIAGKRRCKICTNRANMKDYFKRKQKC